MLDPKLGGRVARNKESELSGITYFLPPVNEVAMRLCFQSCLSEGGSSLERVRLPSVQDPAFLIQIPSIISKLFIMKYVRSPRAVGLLLECFLVHSHGLLASTQSVAKVVQLLVILVCISGCDPNSTSSQCPDQKFCRDNYCEPGNKKTIN